MLSGITFRLERGAFAALCGVSGSGKSTLLRAFKPELAVAGESRGTIRVLGDDPYVLDAVESATRVGFVMQDPESQIVTDTVWHELAFGLESIGMDTPTMRRRVAETAHFFGIGGWFDRKTTDLSGGQKQLRWSVGAFGFAMVLVYRFILDTWTIVGFVTTRTSASVLTTYATGVATNLTSAIATVAFLVPIALSWPRMFGRIKRKYGGRR